MSVTKEKKQELIKEFATSGSDTGSVFVQCAILTERITNLTKHLQAFQKDHHSRRGLLILVGRRKSLLNYLKKVDHSGYEALIKRLGIRK